MYNSAIQYSVKYDVLITNYQTSAVILVLGLPNLANIPST